MTDRNQEPPAPAVLAGMVHVAAEIAQIGVDKRSKNKDQGFWYRGIDDIMQAMAPLLTKHNLVILPNFHEHKTEARLTRQGKALYEVVVRGVFRVSSAVDGSMVEIATYGEGMDTADKATTKAMAIAFKYALMQGFHIPLEPTEDPDASSHEDTAPEKGPTRADVDDMLDDLDLRYQECRNVAELSDAFASAQAALRKAAKEKGWPREWLADALGDTTGSKDKRKKALASNRGDEPRERERDAKQDEQAPAEQPRRRRDREPGED